MENALLKIIKQGYNLSDLYLETEIDQAKDVLQVMDTMDIDQLTDDRFDKFYVNTDKIRGKNITGILAKNFKRRMAGNKKLLFSGFTGSGKTTELIHLSYKLKDDFNILIFSIMNRLKVTNITIESFLFELTGDILTYLDYNDFTADEALTGILEELNVWCTQTAIITEDVQKVQAESGGGIDFKFLSSIFFKAKIEGSFTGKEKRQSKKLEDHKLKDLIFTINKLFHFMHKQTGKDTLVIVDDFEKIPFIKAREFYTHNAMFLNDLFCKMVLTVPIELVYHPDFSLVDGAFGEPEIIPMIKVKDEEGKPNTEGIKLLEEILSKRVNLALFEKKCYQRAVKYSGGSLRELFRIIYEAAGVEEGDIITEQSMEKAIQHYKDIFSSRIQERTDEPKITFQEYLDTLFDIYNGNMKNPERNKALLDLLRIRAVMKYNGEGFYDIHPLLEDFIKAYQKKRDRQGSDKKDPD